MPKLNNLLVSKSCSRFCAIDLQMSFLALVIASKKIQNSRKVVTVWCSQWNSGFSLLKGLLKVPFLPLSSASLTQTLWEMELKNADKTLNELDMDWLRRLFATSFDGVGQHVLPFLGHTSVTRLEDFWKFLAMNILTKEAQTFNNFWLFRKRSTFKVKTTVATFWAMSWKN